MAKAFSTIMGFIITLNFLLAGTWVMLKLISAIAALI